jgi:glycosyltransferase involved in cell wall biosynthesis
MSARAKVLFITSQGAFQLYGGAETALIMLKHYLEKKGIICRIYSYEDNFHDYDIVYLHNMSQFPIEAFRLVQLAKSAGASVISSPIYWSSFESALEYGVGIKKFAHLIAYLISVFVSKTGIDFGLQSSPRLMKLALEQSDLVIVNSNAESELISRHFMIPKRKIRVVYNGVDPNIELADPKIFMNKYDLSDFILYVGRIEPRKNVLRLIKAFNKSALDTHLVIIGQPMQEFYKYYWDLCLKEAAKNPKKIHFLGSFKYSSELLKSAYVSARVFALPSFYETPGLSAIEAAVAGAKLVITNRGCTREYFSDFAIYVDPLSVESIAKGLIKAYHSPVNEDLKRHILTNFTWEKSGDQFIKIIKSIV